MSWQEHDDNCAGCRPAMYDTKNHRQVPDDAPEMQAVLKVWAETTLEERRAWHAFTCQNSRASDVMAIVGPLMVRMSEAVAEVCPPQEN